jgi:hypothetical protein
MIYENIPIIIFMLAVGYLSTIYLLLALIAKRNVKKVISERDSTVIPKQFRQKRVIS